jgi:hypothetical protein
VAIAKGESEIVKGNVAPGIHQTLSGIGTTALPAIPFMGAAAPLATARVIGGGAIGSTLASKGAEKLGASPEWSDVAGDVGGLAGGVAAAPGVFPAIRDVAAGNPDVQALRGLGVPPSSKQSLRTLGNVETARPFLQGVKSEADLQARIPVAKAEIWKPYAEAVERIGEKSVPGPDGEPTTIRDLEADRLETSARLRDARKMQPADLAAADRKNQSIHDLLERDRAIKAVLDPELQRAGVDPQLIRRVHGSVQGVERLVSGKSTLAEPEKPFGFGHVKDINLTKPSTWVSPAWEAGRDLVAGRPVWSGKPTDVSISEAFRNAGPKPTLTRPIPPPLEIRGLLPPQPTELPSSMEPLGETSIPPTADARTRAQRLGLLLPEQAGIPRPIEVGGDVQQTPPPPILKRGVRGLLPENVGGRPTPETNPESPVSRNVTEPTADLRNFQIPKITGPVAAPSEITTTPRGIVSAPAIPRTRVDNSAPRRTIGAERNAETLPIRIAGPGTEGTLPAISPAPEPVRATAPGTETSVRIPGEDRTYPAKYEVRELADVQPSHSGLTFGANEKYKLTNDRDYSNPLNQEKVVSASAPGRFDPSYHITDNPDATNGPIVIDQSGHTLGGNGRAMILQRVYEHNPEGATAYRNLLSQKAQQFGIDPKAIAGMKQPVLVRTIATDDPALKQTAITDFNKVGTAQMTPAERAIADSRRVSQGTLDTIAARLEQGGVNATMAEVLEGRSGTEVLDHLIDDGVITPQERAALANENQLTPAGKERISKLTIARFFRDPAQIDSTPPAIRGKMEALAAPLARVDGIPGWDLTEHVQDALDLLEEGRSHGLGNAKDVVSQQGLWGDSKYSPEAIALAQRIKSDGVRALTKSVRQYAQDAMDATGPQRPLGGSIDPKQAFAEAFGKTR